MISQQPKRLAIIVIYITFDYVIMFFIEILKQHDFLNKQGKRQVIVRIPMYSIFLIRYRFHHVYAIRCDAMQLDTQIDGMLPNAIFDI